MRADRRWYHTADRQRLVPEGHPDSAFLAYCEGDEVPDSVVELLVDGEWVDVTEDVVEDEQPAKSRRPAANKSRRPSANK